MKQIVYVPLLDTRASNCLHNELVAELGINDELDPKRVAVFTEDQLKRIPNMGKRSIAMIKAWLQLNGYQLSVEDCRCPTCGQKLRKRT